MINGALFLYISSYDTTHISTMHDDDFYELRESTARGGLRATLSIITGAVMSFIEKRVGGGVGRSSLPLPLLISGCRVFTAFVQM